MININRFISENITSRPSSMFIPDIEANKEQLSKEISGKSILVIGGAGSIGSNFIKACFALSHSLSLSLTLARTGLQN